MEFLNSQFSVIRGIKGFKKVYEDALRYQYMITEKALKKARILAFWEKHGLEATLEAFGVKRRTLFLWKQKLEKGRGRLESLNDRKRTPHTKRKRLWPEGVLKEIQYLREAHPNLGKEKIYPLLKSFCDERNIDCPTPSTIGRLIKDMGGLRCFPRKITFLGRIKPLKRRKVLRKPKNVTISSPGQMVALDSIEKHIHGKRRYLITFEDIYTRFGFAWSTTSHASQAAKEFFEHCQQVFPFPIQCVLTDNGSEFAKHFSEEMKRLHLIHYHTYPRTPKMNAHCERFNRTIQEEFVNYHSRDLEDPNQFNGKLIDWLIWYNTKRVHHAFGNKLTPIQFMTSLNPAQLPQECKDGWTYTHACKCKRKALY